MGEGSGCGAVVTGCGAVVTAGVQSHDITAQQFVQSSAAGTAEFQLPGFAFKGAVAKLTSNRLHHTVTAWYSPILREAGRE